MSSLQPLVFLCIVLIYLFFGEDAQRREYLLNTRDHLRLEALDLPNKTYRANDTYVLPRAIATSVTQLFGQADKDPKSHYYHNITGSFRGRWSIDLETAGLVDKEQPLPEAPEDDDKEKNGSSDSKAPTEPASGGNNTSNTEGPSSSNSTLLADEPGADDGENMEHGMVDAILNTKPKHQGDVATFRGTSFNYTNPGYLQINLKEQKASESINWIEGLWQLKHDDEEDYGLSLAVMGVHFIHNGSIYMWGIPQDAHMPLSHILELMPDEVSFAMAKEAIKDHYDTKIQHVEDILYGVEEYERYEPIASEEASCNYQIFMQLGAVGPEVKPVHLKELEKEWATPQGISTIKAPLLNATMVMYSPNCRLVMQSKHMPGMKIETFYKKCLRLAVVAGVITFIQVFLLAKQLQFTQTPSSVSKVSYWTITIQMIMDAYLFVIYYAAGAILERLFLPFAGAAFFSCVIVAIFGMRYMHVIWRIQRPERRGRRAAAAAASAPAGGTNPDGLPLPATARRPSPPSEREQSHLDIQTLARRFYWAFVVAIFIMFEMVWSSRLVKNILWTVIASVMFSFWVPQIIRNALRGSSKALNLWYILGMSVTRLLFPLYLHACPENVFNNEPTPWIWLLVGWVFLQVVVLLLQDWLGPRFFVPVRFLPPVYDYHPILPAQDEEGGQGAGGGAPPPAQDCAICMLPIDTTSAHASGNSLMSGRLSRLNYMLTPCGHLFHTDCLEKWMRIKLECPNCRTFLPGT